MTVSCGRGAAWWPAWLRSSPVEGLERAPLEVLGEREPFLANIEPDTHPETAPGLFDVKHDGSNRMSSSHCRMFRMEVLTPRPARAPGRSSWRCSYSRAEPAQSLLSGKPSSQPPAPIAASLPDPRLSRPRRRSPAGDATRRNAPPPSHGISPDRPGHCRHPRHLQPTSCRRSDPNRIRGSARRE
jgi:hypothetical protein